MVARSNAGKRKVNCGSPNDVTVGITSYGVGFLLSAVLQPACTTWFLFCVGYRRFTHVYLSWVSVRISDLLNAFYDPTIESGI